MPGIRAASGRDFIAAFVAGTDDEQQEFDYLGAWGPRFEKLADMYGQDVETEEEEEEEQ